MRLTLPCCLFNGIAPALRSGATSKIAPALRGGAWLLALTLLTQIAACKVFDSTCSESDRNCLASQLFAKGVDGNCERDSDCKAGLYCTKGQCEPDGSTKHGEKCRLTAECGDEDYCGNKRVCQLAGLAPKGDKCRDTGGCLHGLVCEAPDLSQLGVLSLGQLADVSGKCVAGGNKEQGASCDSVVECLAGLQCAPLMSGSEDKVCVSLPPTPAEIPALPPLWPGGTCPVVTDNDPKAYFEVPRGGKPLDEFYALPFPNDIRLKDGHIDMSGHAVAPDTYGMPIVERNLKVAGEDLSGFSTNPVVFFRFSHQYDSKTVKCVTGGECNMKIVDITPTSPEYNEDASMEWKTITQGSVGRYICPHWLALHRPVGTPLRPGTTYAAVITTGIHPADGGSFGRSADLAAMLAPSAPGNADLKAAYTAYEPLRAWAADTNQNVDSILNAAVFTTQKVDEIVPKLRAQIRDDGAATLSDLTVCASANTKSPCEDADGRGKCQAASSDFTEIHGHISLPIFQKGTLPYLNPEDGGGIELDSNGDPVIQDHQDVCFAMSVPTAPAPASGYPVLVYGHGTGGSFAGEMDSSGFAQVVATASTPSVLVAIDMPEHGSRRGDSTDDPENLFYNFLNPRAARDNVLQGSADLMSVVYWATQGGLSAAESPTSQAIALDKARIALMGHSQGATHSALIASYEPDVIGVVLSGNGGHLSTSMLTKTMPFDIASVVPFGLLDPDDKGQLSAGIYNPALAVIQSVFDRADPINYARHVWLDATTEVPSGHHLFMTYGLGDTFAPVETQAAYAHAGRLTTVQPTLEELGLPPANAPLQDNAVVGGVQRTIGLRQYSPKDGSDGHFVGIRKGQDGRVDVEHFLDLLLNGQTPAIGK